MESSDTSHTSRTLVVGAGASGLVALKSCLQAQFSFTICYEQSEVIGGLWSYQPTANEHRGSVSKTTTVNTSKETMCFSDFLFHDDTPNYPTHKVVQKYLEGYAKEFDLFDCIKFQRKVMEIKKINGNFSVVSQDLTSGLLYSEIFDYVMICNGRHFKKKMPQFNSEKEFKGKVIHSHEYRDPLDFKDNRVCIVGIGNTAVDIAVDLSKICPQVYLSTEKGSYIISRTSNAGLPVDLIATRRVMQQLLALTPKWIYDRMAARKANQYFDHDLYGLTPKHGFSEVHTTVSDDICNRIITGEVQIMKNIDHFTDTGVSFTDGTCVDVDLVIYATGYIIDFPFLSEDIVSIKDNRLEMFNKIFLADVPDLAFIGFVQPLGPVFPVCEMQARYAVEVFKKNITLPSPAKMVSEIRRETLRQGRLYSSSSRHTLECSWFEYMQQLAARIGCLPRHWLTSALLDADPSLAGAMGFGILSPAQYRLRGEHAWPAARSSLLELRRRVETPFGRERAQARAQRRGGRWWCGGEGKGARAVVVLLWMLSLAGLVVVYQFVKRTSLFGI